MNADAINSKAYWDYRFLRDWQANSGREQTAFFAHVALSTSPAWLLDEIRSRKLSICDWGCATGDAARDFARAFPDSEVVGYDISENAIWEGRRLFPGLQLVAGDLLAENHSFDIIFSSNTLEHFHDVPVVLSRLSARARHYLWLLLPFQDPGGIEEHFFRFDYDNIPVAMGKEFVLAYFNEIDVSGWHGTQWHGKQAVLVYARGGDALDRIAPHGCEVSAPGYSESFVSPSPEAATQRLALRSLQLMSAVEAQHSADRTAMLEVEAARSEAAQARAEVEAARSEAAQARMDAEAKLARAQKEALSAEAEATTQMERTVRLEEALSESEKRSAEAARHIAQITSHCEELMLRARTAEADCEELMLRARTAEAEREQILSSTSWRITGPLRRAVIMLRKRRPDEHSQRVES